jgi:PEP-CTERM motif
MDPASPYLGGLLMKSALGRTIAAAFLSATYFGAIGSAQAAPIVFNDVTAYQNAAALAGIPLNTETFSAFPPFTALPQTANGITVSTNNNGFIGFSFDSTNAVVFTTQSSGTSITFTFSTPINAFGVSVYHLGTVGATDLSITTTGAPQLVYDGFTYGGGSLLLFAGVFDSATTFMSATVTNTALGDYVELDNVLYGSAAPVPEPGTLTLLGAGLAGLRFLRRKRAA